MPIRGHSGVQGGAEMGCYATALPGRAAGDRRERGRAVASSGASRCPAAPGLTAPEMLDAAALEVLFAAGGNFLEVLPDPAAVEAALGARAAARAHGHRALDARCWSSPPTTVLLLPAATRYEVPGGVTETSTERRVILSPEVPGPRIGEARPEWEVLLDLARRVRPELAERLELSGGTPELRARDRRGRAALPRHRGAARGRRLVPVRRPAPVRGLATSRPPTAGRTSASSSRRRPCRRTGCSRSRRAAASSSTRWCRPTRTPSPGAMREAVLVNPDDAARLGISEGDEVVLRSAHWRAARPRPPRADRAGQRPGALARGQRADRRASAARPRPASPTTTRARAWSGRWPAVPCRV